MVFVTSNNVGYVNFQVLNGVRETLMAEIEEANDRLHSAEENACVLQQYMMMCENDADCPFFVREDAIDDFHKAFGEVLCIQNEIDELQRSLEITVERMKEIAFNILLNSH